MVWGGRQVPFTAVPTSRRRHSGHPCALQCRTGSLPPPTPTSRLGDPVSRASDRGLGTTKTSDSRLEGDWDQGCGEGELLLPRNGGDCYSAGRGPNRGRRNGMGGVEIGEGEKGATRRRQGWAARWAPGGVVPWKGKIGESKKERTTNPNMTRAQPRCRKSPEEGARQRSAESRHRKRKRSTAFWPWEQEK